MNELWKFARLCPQALNAGARSAGRYSNTSLGCLSATVIHHKPQMYGPSRAGAARGECSIHAPAAWQGMAHVRFAGLVQFSTSRLVGLRYLGRGLRGSGLFGLRGRVNARLANCQSADDLICHLSQPLPSHFVAPSRYVPNVAAEPMNAVHEIQTSHPGEPNDR